MRFLSPIRKPRVLWQGPKFRVGAASRIGVVQWYPKRKSRRERRKK